MILEFIDVDELVTSGTPGKFSDFPFRHIKGTRLLQMKLIKFVRTPTIVALTQNGSFLILIDLVVTIGISLPANRW